MELQQARNLVNKLRREGLKAEIYEDYSGRGMFGAVTFGVVTNSARATNKFRVDNSGLDYIYY